MCRNAHATVKGVKVDEHTRHPVPPGSVLNASRPAVRVPREPSWGRVLATTIKVWVAWRLRSLGFGPQGTAGRTGQARFGRPASRLTTPRWHLAALVLALAVITVITLQFTDILPELPPWPPAHPPRAARRHALMAVSLRPRPWPRWRKPRPLPGLRAR